MKTVSPSTKNVNPKGTPVGKLRYRGYQTNQFLDPSSLHNQQHERQSTPVETNIQNQTTISQIINRQSGSKKQWVIDSRIVSSSPARVI